jgi:hemoglobin-like flavoprotein
MDLINSRLTANDLMEEAPDTVNFYLRRAIKHIEDNFGEGYAKEHPELLAGFIQACATELHTAIQAKEISDAIIAVAEQLNEITRIVGTITSMNEGGNNA